MDQHTLRSPRARRRRAAPGRGNATGQGTYAGRGLKGQKARNNIKPGFEGGQNPLVRRIPRLRGFRNFRRVEFPGRQPRGPRRSLRGGRDGRWRGAGAERLLDDADQPFKVLARGELSHALAIKAPRLSKAAKEASPPPAAASRSSRRP